MNCMREEKNGMTVFHFYLPLEKIAYARFILEGYDNMGHQTSSPGSSHVVWTVPADFAGDAENLLNHLLS